MAKASEPITVSGGKRNVPFMTKNLYNGSEKNPTRLVAVFPYTFTF
ncbi:Uncharacterised protein [Yersinia enterocolitica]|nr:Uncharacterised protein [Yersinia enterocolitica]